MGTKTTERWTGEKCKRGAPIKERVERDYVLQLDGPYEEIVTRMCCVECEAEGD